MGEGGIEHDFIENWDHHCFMIVAWQQFIFLGRVNPTRWESLLVEYTTLNGWVTVHDVVAEIHWDGQESRESLLTKSVVKKAHFD